MTTIVNLTPHAITITGADRIAGLAAIDRARGDLDPPGDHPDHSQPPPDWILPPSGTIARAAESVEPAAEIYDHRSDPDAAGTRAWAIPTTRVTFGAVDGLPEPRWTAAEGSGYGTRNAGPGRRPAVYYVVSMVVALVARAQGRALDDLLVPGQQVRDVHGRVIGCRSLARA